MKIIFNLMVIICSFSFLPICFGMTVNEDEEERSLLNANQGIISNHEGNDLLEETGELLALSTIRDKTIEFEDLPYELQFHILSFLNQRDIPNASRVSKSWQALMNDNNLWKVYARKAFIILKNDPSEQNHKELVKGQCVPSFTDLGRVEDKAQSYTNFDGSVVVGTESAGIRGPYRAFRWTAENGKEFLGTLNGGDYSSVAGVNFSGSVIVGTAVDGALDRQRAFRWTAEKGMESLGVFDGGNDSYANGISFDGSVIVGSSSAKDTIEYNGAIPFRWTAKEGMVFLGTFNKDYPVGHARAVNFDGSVIVGGAGKAFRWTPEKGMESLGTLNGGTYSNANGVSFDGSIIVGASHTRENPGLTRAFRWTAEKGMEYVGKLLAENGLLPKNVVLYDVSTLSPNGAVLTGYGNKQEGCMHQTIAWRAVIPRKSLF